MKITVTTTPGELLDRLRWTEACVLLGMNEWAVNEGLMGRDDEITMTEAQAWKLGLVQYRPGLENDPSLAQDAEAEQ